MASPDLRPGSSDEKSSTGRIAIKRRKSAGLEGAPLSISFHEKTAGRPASTFSSDCDAIDRGRANSSSVAIFFRHRVKRATALLSDRADLDLPLGRLQV